jgi:hypothetical protein
MVALLVVGTIIGLIWADTSDVAGSIAVVTNIIGVVGIVCLPDRPCRRDGASAPSGLSAQQRDFHPQLKPARPGGSSSPTLARP